MAGGGPGLALLNLRLVMEVGSGLIKSLAWLDFGGIGTHGPVCNKRKRDGGSDNLLVFELIASSLNRIWIIW